MTSKECKLCSVSKEEHLSQMSIGGILFGCKFENNFIKNYFLNLKKRITKNT